MKVNLHLRFRIAGQSGLAMKLTRPSTRMRIVLLLTCLSSATVLRRQKISACSCSFCHSYENSCCQCCELKKMIKVFICDGENISRGLQFQVFFVYSLLCSERAFFCRIVRPVTWSRNSFPWTWPQPVRSCTTVTLANNYTYTSA
jgi:hypothetical protein